MSMVKRAIEDICELYHNNMNVNEIAAVTNRPKAEIIAIIENYYDSYFGEDLA